MSYLNNNSANQSLTLPADLPDKLPRLSHLNRTTAIFAKPTNQVKHQTDLVA
jgi:hypothetical protein